MPASDAEFDRFVFLASIARRVLQNGFMSITLRCAGPGLLLLASVASAREEIRPDFEMDHDPEIRIPAAVKVFSERLKPLWLEALARPEADMQRMAADAIGRAHGAGFVVMDEAVSRLAAVLAAPDSRPVARQAAARALVLLDAKEAAPHMAESAEKNGADLRLIVEPALADWNYEPHRSIWQARLSHTTTRHRDLILAIRCLARVKDNSRVDVLVEIAAEPFRAPDVRVEAAQAAGLLQDSGLESAARRLMTGGQPDGLVNRLCAVRLLTRHGSEDAQKLLLELAVDQDPVVASVALSRLIEIDPHLVLPLAEGAMQNADAIVRQRGADAYVLVPDPQRIVVLCRLLDDPHPAVRSSVRDSLHELARRPELDEPVRKAATEMLAGDRWRGLEQAGLLLGALDHKPAAGRLMSLLEFDRPEVGIAAAWGLKKLAIPETLPKMFDKASRNTEIRKNSRAPFGLDEQTAHLFEAFGRTRFESAVPLLLEYVPKDVRLTFGFPSRGAAIWSLGLIYAGAPNEPLARALMERIADDGGPATPPELPLVKQSSAVAIARMKAISQAVPMRNYYDSKGQADQVTMSLLWAMTDLTSEQILELPPPKRRISNWFLESLDN